MDIGVLHFDQYFEQLSEIKQKVYRCPMITQVVFDYSPDAKRFLVEIQDKLDYTFKDPLILLQALTHSSDTNRLLQIAKSYFPSLEITNLSAFHYERLEFLGDSILNFLVAEHFFLKTEGDVERKNPKELHKLKTAMCNNMILSMVMIENGFHNCIIFNRKGNQNFLQQFEKY